jgi:hypothetical protein
MNTIEVNEKNELIRRKEVEGTPFVVVEVEGKCFATLGNYKITEDFETGIEAESAIKEINWKNLINLMIVINDYCKSLDKLENIEQKLKEN